MAVERGPRGAPDNPSEARRLAVTRRRLEQGGRRRKSLAPTILAGLVLASSGAYLALRNFPRARRAALAGKIRDALQNPQRYGISKRAADAIYRGLDHVDNFFAGAADKLRPQQTLQKIFETSSFNDPEVTKALQLVRNAVVDRPQAFATVDDIVRGVGYKYRAPSATDPWHLRRLRVGDLFDEAGEWNRVFGEMPEMWKEKAGLIQEVVTHTPGLRSTLYAMPIDQGLLAYKNKMIDVRRFMPQTWMKGLDDAAKRGSIWARAGRKLADWLTPAGVLYPTPSMATTARGSVTPFLKKAYGQAPKGFVENNLTGGLYMGGTLFPQFRGGNIGAGVKSGLMLGRVGSGMGRTMGAAGRRYKKIDEYLTANQEGIRKWGMAGKGYEFVLRQMDKIGVGPRYRTPIPEGAPEGAGEILPKTLARFLSEPGQVAKERWSNLANMFRHVPPKGPEKYFATTPHGAIDKFLNYQLHRVSWLLEEGAGIGMKPGRTSLGTAAKWLGLAGAAWATTKYAGYANYLGREYLGMGPLDVPIHAYMAGRRSLQGVMDVMGVTHVANYLEETFPGSVKSPGSRVLQGIGAGVLAKKFGAPGAVIAGVGALAFGTDVTMPAAQLGRIYRGEEDVPVRRSRFWMLSGSPFFGGPIEYHRPHLLAMALTDYKKESIYGSAASYYAKGTYLPTPSNLFGFRTAADPYYVEKRNWYTRPYPLSGSVGGEIPIIGPAVEATLGRLIKPMKRQYLEYWHDGAVIDPDRFQGVRGRPGAGDTSDAQSRSTVATGPLRLDQSAGKQLDMLREFTGLPGFLMGVIKAQITGDADFYGGRQIANAGQMTSYERGYEDLRLGGMAGLTELYRRFLPGMHRRVDTINPILNDAPSWLPGSYSSFRKDRRYHLDYHRGDPRAAIPHGEARLPGPGWEALHRLSSGIPGVYDALDRYKILADVAPYSEAYKHYEAIVLGQLRTSGMARESEGKGLEPYFASGMKGIVTRVVDGDTLEVDIGGRLTTVRMAGINTPESKSTNRRENTAEGVLAHKVTSELFRDKRVRINPIDTDHYGRLIAKVESDEFHLGRGPGELLRQAYPTARLTDEHRAEFDRTKSQVRDRLEPYRFYEKIFAHPFAAVPRNARKLQTMSQEMWNTNLKEAGQYTMPEKFAGWAYEQVAHFEPPGPLRWFKDKWFPVRSAAEHYERFRVVGSSFAPWETPVDSFVKPWAYSALNFMKPGTPVIPSHVKKRWAIDSHFDRLKYAKSKVLALESRQYGRADLLRYWDNQAKRTATYALATGNANFARAGLPRLDRPYYNAFTRLHTEEERDRVRSMVSPDMRGLLELSWSGMKPQGGDPDVEAATYLGSTGYPDKDWAGWAPGTPLDLAKLKVAQNEGVEYHDLGLTQAQEAESELVFDDWNPIQVPDLGRAAEIRAHMYRLLSQSGYSDVVVEVTERPEVANSASVSMRHRRKFMTDINRFMGYALDGYGMRF